MKRSLVSPGDAFRLRRSLSGELVLLVLRVLSRRDRDASCEVLMLEVEQEAFFRARAGQVTEWSFSSRDEEWGELERLS